MVEGSGPGGSDYDLYHLMCRELSKVKVEMFEASEAVGEEERRKRGEV